ncbi:MAG TPA: galactokinase family protein [bacterium]|nr:galactokinase family protein [bacterium]
MNTVTFETANIAKLHHMEYETMPEVVVSAPGIVRLLGEHTTDADGLVLAFPFNRRVTIAFSSRHDSSIRFFAADLNERKRTNLSNLKFKREDRWANYIKAEIASIAERNTVRGFNITISGDVPQGLGLGSATALQCAAAWAVCLVSGHEPVAENIARSIVETDKAYFERSSKSADYLATLAAKASSFSYIDALKGTAESIPSVLRDVQLILTDSRVPRPPLDSELRQRSNDCATGLSIMVGSGSRRLRDYTIDELDEFMGIMPERVRRHCAFIVDEAQRVREAREAALHADMASFAKAMNKSQAGLRNNYEISCPEIDWLVKRALEIDGIMASRMIGKGFGGCTLTLAQAGAAEEYRSRLEEYERIFGFKPSALEISVGTGMIAE